MVHNEISLKGNRTERKYDTHLWGGEAKDSEINVQSDVCTFVAKYRDEGV